MRIYGIDFTSAPRRDKPIVVAQCEADGAEIELQRFLEFADWPAYDQWLGEDGEWLGGFDFPFGLPRRFVEKQGWPTDWPGMVRECVRGGKERFVVEGMRAFRTARTVADKHRATDLEARSESPLKTAANPPVGRMFYEGAWRLLAHGLHVPGLNETGSPKVALEVYPGLLVRRLGERYYKNDKASSEAANRAARRRIRAALNAGHQVLSCRLRAASPKLAAKLDHSSGDWLDAVACAFHAHWGWIHRKQNFGLPANVDPVEGWIVAA